MGATGLELRRFPSENTEVPASGGSKSGNKDAPSGGSPGAVKPADPDLARVVAAWATLPPAIKAGIVALVKAATGTEGNR